MQILDGKIVSQAVKDAIKIKTTALKSAGKKHHTWQLYLLAAMAQVKLM